MNCRDCRADTASGYFQRLEGSGGRHKEPLCQSCYERAVRRVTADAVHGGRPVGSGSGRVVRKSTEGPK